MPSTDTRELRELIARELWMLQGIANIDLDPDVAESARSWWDVPTCDPEGKDEYRRVADRILAIRSPAERGEGDREALEREESVQGAMADFEGNRADLDAAFQVKDWYPAYGADYNREVNDLYRDLGSTVAAIYHYRAPASSPPAPVERGDYDAETCPWSVTSDGSFRCTRPRGHNGLHHVVFGDAEHFLAPPPAPVEGTRRVSMDERAGRLRAAAQSLPEPWAVERVRVELPALLDRLAALPVQGEREEREVVGGLDVTDIRQDVKNDLIAHYERKYGTQTINDREYRAHCPDCNAPLTIRTGDFVRGGSLLDIRAASPAGGDQKPISGGADNGKSSADAASGGADQPEPCGCRACVEEREREMPWHERLPRFIVCPECGNKRCPKATFHGLACTNSNEPDQPGSAFSSQPWPLGASPAPSASEEEPRG